MSRLFLILVKKFGYAAAKRMAPQYGISQGVMNKTARQIDKRYMASGFGRGGTNYIDYPFMAGPNSPMQSQAGGVRLLKQMGRRGLGRTGPPQAPGRGLREMEQRAEPAMSFRDYIERNLGAGEKNIDKIIRQAKGGRGRTLQVTALETPKGGWTDKSFQRQLDKIYGNTGPARKLSHAEAIALETKKRAMIRRRKHVMLRRAKARLNYPYKK